MNHCPPIRPMRPDDTMTAYVLMALRSLGRPASTRRVASRVLACAHDKRTGGIRRNAHRYLARLEQVGTVRRSAETDAEGSIQWEPIEGATIPRRPSPVGDRVLSMVGPDWMGTLQIAAAAEASASRTSVVLARAAERGEVERRTVRGIRKHGVGYEWRLT
jgi:hypothetical protein